MSSRMLKKIHGDNLEIKLDEQQVVSDLETELSSAAGGTKKKQLNINRYDLLLPESESEVKEDDNETEHLSAASAPASEQAKKKKKKRKKKGGKHTSQRRSSEDNADVSDLSVSRSTFSARKTDDRDDDFLGQSISPKLQAVTTSKIKSLFNIQHKNLNSFYEMKRMFGSKVMFLFKNKRRNVRGQRPIKSTWLVNAKDVWPPVGKTGLSMNLVQQKLSEPYQNSDVIYFAFDHSPVYRQLQERFLAAVESNNTDNIMKIVNEQPYHVDSLIQLSELCKMTEEMSTAADLVEHAIFALESSFHPLFNLTAGNCRLDYRRQENRSLFIAMFKHAQYLDGRACPRTALEISKLILTFDPIDDPLAMILVIDFYAIRSKQYEWLIELYKEWENSHNLSQLPNMAYSFALALFYRNKENCEEQDAADLALQYALMMFPSVLKPLLDENSVQIDSRVNNHHYFGTTATKTQSAALLPLTALYVCRSKLVWRDPEILPWLEKNVNTVLDRVDAKEEIVTEYALKRSQRYKNPPREILRHIVLSDYKEKVPLMAFIFKENEPIVMYDPLPPLDSINIYTKPKMSASHSFLQRNTSSLSMFFQSLMPSFNAPPTGVNQNQNANAVEGGQQPPEQRQGGEVGGVVAEGAMGEVNNNENNGEVAAGGATALAGTNTEDLTELRSSLDSINEFLRCFLSNTWTPERPNDADVDESDDVSTEDDENANNYST